MLKQRPFLVDALALAFSLDRELPADSETRIMIRNLIKSLIEILIEVLIDRILPSVTAEITDDQGL